MPTLSNYSDCEEEQHDIVAEYEKKDFDGEQDNANESEHFGSENEENTEETKRIINPSSSIRQARNPLPKLNTERLRGSKGIQTIEKYFEGFKFHGKGYEKLDLDRIMKRMEHWAHRLFPRLEFDDFLEKLEKLGTKKDLQVFVQKYRNDMISTDNDVIVNDNEEAGSDKELDEPMDEFDLLIAEQIEKQKKVAIQQSTSAASNETFDKLLSQSISNSSQSIKQTSTSSQLTDEIKERIERNRQQAIQRRLARLQATQEDTKKKKLEGNEDTQQLQNNPSCDSQIAKEDQDRENKDLDGTLQNTNVEFET